MISRFFVAIWGILLFFVAGLLASVPWTTHAFGNPVLYGGCFISALIPAGLGLLAVSFATDPD